MASTIYIGEMLNVVGTQFGRKFENDFAAVIVNLAINEIWLRYDWRESIALLPPFYLVPNEQDFGRPAYALPTNFLGLREAYLVNLQAAPPVKRELTVIKDVRETNVQDLPRDIGYVPSTGGLRVFPRVPPNISSTSWLIEGTYKKRPTKVTSSSVMSTLIPWDDIYLNVFLAALRWAAWNTSGDQRAGQTTVQNGLIVHTGQLAEMNAQIDWMAQQEGLNLGDATISPAEPLIGGGITGYAPYPGALGW